MLIRFGYDIVYNLPVRTPLVLMLHLRPELAPRLLLPESLTTLPGVETEEFLDGFGNRCTRLTAPAGRFELTCDAVIEDWGCPRPS